LTGAEGAAFVEELISSVFPIEESIFGSSIGVVNVEFPQKN